MQILVSHLIQETTKDGVDPICSDIPNLWLDPYGCPLDPPKVTGEE
jgi:hypothetical protein